MPGRRARRGGGTGRHPGPSQGGGTVEGGGDRAGRRRDAGARRRRAGPAAGGGRAGRAAPRLGPRGHPRQCRGRERRRRPERRPAGVRGAAGRVRRGAPVEPARHRDPVARLRRGDGGAPGRVHREHLLDGGTPRPERGARLLDREGRRRELHPLARGGPGAALRGRDPGQRDRPRVLRHRPEQGRAPQRRREPHRAGPGHPRPHADGPVRAAGGAGRLRAVALQRRGLLRHRRGDPGGRRLRRGERRLMHEDLGFDPDPETRRVALRLYDETRDLPIVSPHGHVDPRILALDEPFPEPTGLIVLPDHYILRMLYSQGIPLERLGLKPADGAEYERDPRRIWQLLGEHFHLFRATPVAIWLTYQLRRVFRVAKKLDGDTAQAVYDEIREKLGSPEFRPRALFERFRIEVLATTDAAADPLESHRVIRESGWKGRVIPTFRPDALFRIAAPEWNAELERLVGVDGTPIAGYAGLVRALVRRRAVFRGMGATATDHGVEEPFTE